MRETLKTRCDLFFENRTQVKEAFKWENDSLISVCASMLMNSERRVDSARLKDCKAMLKEQTSVFSNFRGNVEMSVVSMMAMSDNPAAKLARTLDYYKALKEQFSSSEYLVLAAAILSETVAPENIGTVAARAKNIYKLMKEEHPFLTSSEDSVSAVMMAVSDKMDDKALINEAETIYQILKETFSSSNDVQAVSFVLALADGYAQEKSQKLINLYDALKLAGVKYGKYYELTTLAALSIIPVDVNSMVEEIIFADECLSKEKPYSGVFGLDKKTRLMHAAMVVSSELSEGGAADIATMTSTLAMIAAQQAALCATICASSAASSAAAAN